MGFKLELSIKCLGKKGPMGTLAPPRAYHGSSGEDLNVKTAKFWTLSELPLTPLSPPYFEHFGPLLCANVQKYRCGSIFFQHGFVIKMPAERGWVSDNLQIFTNPTKLCRQVYHSGLNLWEGFSWPALDNFWMISTTCEDFPDLLFKMFGRFHWLVRIFWTYS